jgi:hypothetical protein
MIGAIVIEHKKASALLGDVSASKLVGEAVDGQL